MDIAGGDNSGALAGIAGASFCVTTAPSCGAPVLRLSPSSRPPRPRPPRPRRRRLRPSPSSLVSGGRASKAGRGCWLRGGGADACSGAPPVAVAMTASSGLFWRGGWLRSPPLLPPLGGRSPRGSLRPSLRPSARLPSLRSPLLPRSLRSLRLRAPRSLRSPPRLLRSPRPSRLPSRAFLAPLLASVSVVGAVTVGTLSPPNKPTKRFQSDGAGVAAFADADCNGVRAACRSSRAIGSDDIGAGWSGVMPLTTGSGRAGFASAAVGSFMASSSTGLLTNS